MYILADLGMTRVLFLVQKAKIITDLQCYSIMFGMKMEVFFTPYFLLASLL